MTTMTMEQNIEELRRELGQATDAAERRQIEAELQLAQGELIIALAELDGELDPEPPF
ncbi:hypothetical protein NXT3_PC00151 (plasmid) [Sinorhizobium fredii]|uniref:Uncharacterized protein n=2 Tax=Rhizobium fredii TaxID=380 RepID=A0A2L0HCU6_RHIFR|nr:hypothetical protein NXT3_PC00151 [Sinorhizobium fredii]